MRGEAVARMIGRKRIRPFHIRIQQPRGTVRFPDGVRRNAHSEPFMPAKLTDEYHPGGNSLCYMIQTAHLMGCNPIYALGFTLQSGSGYFFGSRTNPVTYQRAIYDAPRALHWLSWYQEHWPGRVQLVEGWSGPAYDVLPEVTCDELKSRSAALGAGQAEPDPEPLGGDGPALERLRSDRGDQPVRWLL